MKDGRTNPAGRLMGALYAARDHVLDVIGPKAPPQFGLILGSGLGNLAEMLDNATALRYVEIPNWPLPTVEGHAGRLILGELERVPVAILQGRVHLYEGYTPAEVVFPTRVLALLGCRGLVVTNAAGAVNESFKVGELMLISDHLNLQGSNPCVGTNPDGFGARFFDMTRAYDPEYRVIVRDTAAELGITLQEGVYAALLGPSYETPAEIRMLHAMGADAVGMSTAPEIIAAVHAGLRTVGISCLTNMAAGLLDEQLDHEEVMRTGERAGDDLVALLRGLVASIATHAGGETDG